MAIDLKEKAGPFPYWGWIIGGVAVVAGVSWWRSRSAGSSTAASTDTAAGGADSIAGLGSGTSGAGTVTTVGGVPAPTNDAAWGTQATDDLISRGYDPNLVESAISDYLSGQQLSQAEQAVISVALGNYGSPPEGVIPVLGGTASGSPGSGTQTGGDGGTGTGTTGGTGGSYTTGGNGGQGGTGYNPAAPPATIEAVQPGARSTVYPGQPIGQGQDYTPFNTGGGIYQAPPTGIHRV